MEKNGEKRSSTTRTAKAYGNATCADNAWGKRI
jgi:hypothetical protein